jgi:peptide deformylase
MSIRTLHLLGSPALREPSTNVTVDDAVRALVDDLFETMRAAQGVGLAANQIGITQRVAVVDVNDKAPLVLINPVITTQFGSQRGEEGCLSIPELYGEVNRAMEITVETTTLEGERTTVDAVEFKARAILHEIDHLDGILFIDHLSPLKRRMLLKKWQKMRKGETGFLKEIDPATVGE